MHCDQRCMFRRTKSTEQDLPYSMIVSLTINIVNSNKTTSTVEPLFFAPNKTLNTGKLVQLHKNINLLKSCICFVHIEFSVLVNCIVRRMQTNLALLTVVKHNTNWAISSYAYQRHSDNECEKQFFSQLHIDHVRGKTSNCSNITIISNNVAHKEFLQCTRYMRHRLRLNATIIWNKFLFVHMNQV